MAKRNRYDEDDAGGPEEDDITTSDHMHFYQNGRCVLTLKNKAGEPYANSFMWMKLREFMKSQNFYPNVWFISDHGNAHLMRPSR